MNQKAALSQLRFASWVLFASVLPYSLMLLPKGMIDGELKFRIIWATSSLCCIAGFLLANLSMGLVRRVYRFSLPDAESYSVLGARMANQTGAVIFLLFYASFVMPFINVLVAWGLALRARWTASGIEASLAQQRVREAQRRRMTSGA